MTDQPVRRRRWLRWLVRLAVLAVAARILLALLLPWLVERAAASAGFELRCTAASLSLTGASMHLHGLAFRAANLEHGPAGTVGDLAADLSTWQLLRGRVVLSKVLVSSLHVDVSQREDGRLVLPASAPATSTPAATRPARGGAPSFVLPFAVATARVHDLQLRVFGPGAAEPTHVLVVDAAVADLGRTDVPGTFTVRATSPARADAVTLAGTLVTTGDRAQLAFELTGNGLRLEPWLPDAVQRDAPLDSGLRGSCELTRTGGGDLVLAADATANGTRFVDRLALTAKGTLRADGSGEGAAEVHVDRLVLAAFDPLLRALGLALPPAGLDAGVTLIAQRAADGTLSARMRDLVVGTGPDRCVWPELAVEGLALGDGAIAVRRLASTGPEAAFARGDDGSWSVAGIRWTPPAPSPGANPPAQPGAPTPAAQPRIALQELDARGLVLRYTEAAGARSLLLDGAAVRGEALAFFDDAPPGHLTIDLPLPEAVRQAHIDIRSRPRRDGFGADVELAFAGVTLQRLAPWLAPLGIEPRLADGALRGNATLDAALGAEPRLDLRLANVRLTDGETQWLVLRNAELAGLSPTGAGAPWTALTIDDPVLLIDREATATTLAGLRFATTAAPAPTANAPSPPAPAIAGPSAVATGPVRLRGATVRLRQPDAAAPEVAIGVAATVGAMAADTAVPFDLALRLDQRLEALTLGGTFEQRGDRLALDAELAGKGIRDLALAPWLPPHVACSLVDGSLAGHLHLSATRGATAMAVDCALDGLVLRDRDVELAAVDRVRLVAPTIGSELVHVAELRIDGVRGAVAATADGVAIPGFRLGAEPPPVVPPPTAATRPQRPGGGILPALRIDDLVIGIDRFDYRDRRAGEGAPLSAAVRIELAAPYATAAEVEESEPMHLHLRASTAPLVHAIDAALDVSPFRRRPEFGAVVAVTGIDTTALVEVLPHLADTVRGTETAAALAFTAHGILDLRRTGPTGFDPSQPFGLTAEVTGLAFTGSGGEPLATVPDLIVEARAIDPRRGDVLVHRIEVESPAVELHRDAEGLHVAGLLLKDRPATAPTAPAGPAARTAAAELAIDELVVRGLALDFRDTTTDPPTHLPIEALDLGVHGLSSRATREPLPLAFTLSLRGGPVRLDRRTVRSSLLAGVLGSTGQLLAGARDATAQEERPLVEEIAASGNLILFPRPKGTVLTRVTGFELAALRGLAKTGGVDLADGVYDGTVALDLQPAGAKVKSSSTFRWLQVSEPPGGPISTYLRLPAPLDAVLFALRNADDEQRIPLQLEVPPSGVTAGGIASAAVEALTLLIADAVRSAPTRVLTTVTGAMGIGGGEDLASRAVAVGFPPGSAAGDLEAAAALAAGFADDAEVHFVLVHELGSDDVPPVAALANPPAEFAHAAADRLRIELDAAEARRAALAPEVVARFLAGRRHEAEALLVRLRAEDDAIAARQQTLAAVVAAESDTTPRAAARRTRDGCLEVGAARLQAVRDALLRRLGTPDPARIELRAVRGTPAPDTARGRIVVVPTRRRA